MLCVLHLQKFDPCCVGDEGCLREVWVKMFSRGLQTPDSADVKLSILLPCVRQLQGTLSF